ncbi:helicase, partial [Parabacteroides distasonis]|nr:helicase [Parabacteroides distasonis]
MEANKVTTSHKPPSDGGMAREEFIRVGTTLYKIVEQPRLSGGYVKKRSPAPP